MKPNRIDCARCHELYDDNPPHPRCEKPTEELTPEGATAYRIWRTLHEHDRPYWQADGMPLPLPLASIRGAVADYGLSLETQELIVALDDTAVSLLQKEHAKRMKSK